MMQLIKKVLIKRVITEKSKATLHDSFKQDKVQLERECEQLLFEQRKLIHKHQNSKHDIKKRFQQEIDQRKEQIQLANFKMEQLASLDYGSEIIEKEVEAIVDVTIGSRWSNLNEPTSIIIKDDIVIRIDNE